MAGSTAASTRIPGCLSWFDLLTLCAFTSYAYSLLQMAEGYEQNRDLVEALCCYKSALTWNKDDETTLLPDDYKKKAADRLALVAKELKFSQDWQSQDRKTKDLRPASILKLIQSKVHAKEAVQAYLRCEDFKMSINAKFHLEFGTACKEHPEHRDVAMQALEIASEDSDMEAAARHGQADIQYDRHQYDAAEQVESELLHRFGGDPLPFPALCQGLREGSQQCACMLRHGEL